MEHETKCLTCSEAISEKQVQCKSCCDYARRAAECPAPPVNATYTNEFGYGFIWVAELPKQDIRRAVYSQWYAEVMSPYGRITGRYERMFVKSPLQTYLPEIKATLTSRGIGGAYLPLSIGQIMRFAPDNFVFSWGSSSVKAHTLEVTLQNAVNIIAALDNKLLVQTKH